MTALVNRPSQQVPAPGATQAPETRQQVAARYVWAGLRIALGWIFLWAFLDKTFGSGSPPSGRAPGSTAAARPRAS